ncbi:MAG: MogA/MoaB family molybdenum cofactor biosynthesis protein [Bacteroidetes bacterium]|jgi:molybdopterin adenylyltransferase|nr:MogA/MoaB family molybdenum cofactor biosynthesis protein [Bacteroidota bacterium]MBT3748452.1 MogA/MoaB family molybdenum cofactor biosynthesis protein [Bacteroidota bacterium]MBT4398067.1 MogA/MoaB family molybdenum cofactor biosynthesis protein [Bacteroidota bacterium]MBT4409931.1 MogA/MoaB family molybdenum cofactor biosynthesis protein [Bacteroidota bacterium]MBT5424724.1 MogA/MoaB family molybdenum cofactor biosynthesis protein [Bacteroidota bacterium]
MNIADSIKVLIITLSDRASNGTYEDRSGPEIGILVSAYFQDKGIPVTIQNSLIPDDPNQLKELINEAKESDIQVLFTTGGTGIGPKDFTPDVVREMLDKEIPGIMEMIRVKYGKQKPNALVSRSIAGVADSMLIYTLPGSVKAVREYCAEILPTIIHSLKMLHGIDDHS